MSLELADTDIPKFNGSGLLSSDYQKLIVDALDGKRVEIDIRDEHRGFVSFAD
jgi:hypothetical protein